MTKTLYIMQHGHWYTEIEKLSKDSYRVTTSSGLRNIEPMTLCTTLDQAKKAVAEHMQEVKGL